MLLEFSKQGKFSRSTVLLTNGCPPCAHCLFHRAMTYIYGQRACCRPVLLETQFVILLQILVSMQLNTKSNNHLQNPHWFLKFETIFHLVLNICDQCILHDKLHYLLAQPPLQFSFFTYPAFFILNRYFQQSPYPHFPPKRWRKGLLGTPKQIR